MKLTKGMQVIVDAQVAAEMEKIRAEAKAEYKAIYEKKLEREVEAMVERIDKYLTYVVNMWREENQVAIQSTLRTEVALEFMGRLKTFFEDNYIKIPEKVDVVEALVARVEELKERFAKVTEENVALLRENANDRKEKVLAAFSEGMAEADAKKFRAICADFSPDELLFDRVKTVKELHFTPKEVQNVQESIERSKEDGGDCHAKSSIERLNELFSALIDDLKVKHDVTKKEFDRQSQRLQAAKDYVDKLNPSLNPSQREALANKHGDAIASILDNLEKEVRQVVLHNHKKKRGRPRKN